MDRWQRTAISVLVILIVAGLVLVRMMMDINDLRRQTNTQRLIERVARQVDLYRAARGSLPRDLDDLPLEVPDGFTDTQGSVVDAWGHPLLYLLSGPARSEEYVIASPGRDGAFDQVPEAYARRRSFSSTRGSPDRDTVVVGGRTVQGAVEEEREEKRR